MDIDTLLKTSQTAFYVVATVLTILTYRNACKGLLNPVNTEYHKHVIERLKELSGELLSEYDEFSDNFWAKNRSLQKALQRVRDDFAENRDEIKEPKDFMCIPVLDEWRKMSNSADKIRSDPFIPSKLRDRIHDLIKTRADVLMSVYYRNLERYQRSLIEGKVGKDILNEDNEVHNRMVDELNKQGCGISQIEEEIHSIRTEIQQYFEKHNPIA